MNGEREEQKDGDLHTLRVFTRDKQWLFQLDKIETVTGTNSGWVILNQLFPPELHFIGPADLLRSGQAAERAGMPISVEGRLDIKDRMLAVAAVRDVLKKLL